MDLAGLIKNMDGLTDIGKGRIRKSLYPMFAELTKRSYKTYYDKLRRNSVSPDGVGVGTIASGRLLRAFETNPTKLIEESQDGLRFVLRINSSPATKGYADPADYYAVIDGTAERDVPTVDRILQWMVDRGILKTLDQKFVDGSDGNPIPARYIAIRIIARIRERTAENAYKRLNITGALQKRLDVSNPNSYIRKTTRFTLKKLIFDDTPF